MLTRTTGNALLMTSKIVQKQGNARLLHASAVSMKDKTITEQAKESAHNIAEKAKEVFEKAKEAVGNPSKTAHDAYDSAKETAQNLTGNKTHDSHDSHHHENDHDGKEKIFKQPVATEKSDVKDAYDAKLH